MIGALQRRGMEEVIRRIVTEDEIKWAVGTFQSYTSPSPAAVFPAKIQQFLGDILTGFARIT